MIGKHETVYIAGPMTGLPLFNRCMFFHVAKEIERYYGCRVLNPARQPDGLEYDEYIRRGMQDVGESDVLVMLDGWTSSKGAQLEFYAARHEYKRIIYQYQVEADILMTTKPESAIGEYNCLKPCSIRFNPIGLNGMASVTMDNREACCMKCKLYQNRIARFKISPPTFSYKQLFTYMKGMNTQ